MLQALAEQTRSVRIPLNQNSNLVKLSRTETALTQKLGRSPTDREIADEMEEWLMTQGSDGFTVQFPYLPGGLDDFVDRVVPELQRRGIFRREYEGKTLRDNLGLPRPENQFL